jgi:hypothetical protein
VVYHDGLYALAVLYGPVLLLQGHALRMGARPPARVMGAAPGRGRVVGFAGHYQRGQTAPITSGESSARQSGP